MKKNEITNPRCRTLSVHWWQYDSVKVWKFHLWQTARQQRSLYMRLVIHQHGFKPSRLEESEEVGLKDKVLPLAIPMYGRKFKWWAWRYHLLSHGKQIKLSGPFPAASLTSSSRWRWADWGKISTLSINVNVDFRNQEITFETQQGESKIEAPVIIGARWILFCACMSTKQVRSVMAGFSTAGIDNPATAEGKWICHGPEMLCIFGHVGLWLHCLTLISNHLPVRSFAFEGTKVCLKKINDDQDLESVFKLFRWRLPVDARIEVRVFSKPNFSLWSMWECYPGHSCLRCFTYAMVPFTGKGWIVALKIARF
jgi:kynurenine 3-monooxygenase